MNKIKNESKKNSTENKNVSKIESFNNIKREHKINDNVKSNMDKIKLKEKKKNNDNKKENKNINTKKGKNKKNKLDAILEEFENETKKTNNENIQNNEEIKEEKKENINPLDVEEYDIEKIKKKINLIKKNLPEQDNSYIRLLKNWPEEKNTLQTDPPIVPLDILFENQNYPLGEIQEYKSHVLKDVDINELKEREKIHQDYYDDLRKAAECHRQVRKYMQTYIKPGQKMIEIVQTLENKTKELILARKLKCGWGFPTGCSLNNCVAHYTPNYGDETVLKYDDICKLDFGVHVNGYIIDCAFTIAFDEKYDNLIKATQDGTNTGIKEAGIDARMSDIGAAIQEAIESYEIELNQKVYPIKVVENLRGHSIQKYIIHGGKCVPIVKQHDNNEIMEEGELFAIETFATTGRGYVYNDTDCSHYMKNTEVDFVPIKLHSAKLLLNVINDQFYTLPFCRRWLDDLNQKRHFMALKNLVDLNIISPYPPLCDIKKSFSSQMEHTILLRPTCKEVLSRGCDY